LASVIGIAVDDLGDVEWRIRTGTTAEVAVGFAARLRDDFVPAARASWHSLDATMDEFATVRAALVELAYGTTRRLPDGATHLEIVDLLDELKRQLGR
jgi:hypothetical protein